MTAKSVILWGRNALRWVRSSILLQVTVAIDLEIEPLRAYPESPSIECAVYRNQDFSDRLSAADGPITRVSV